MPKESDPKKQGTTVRVHDCVVDQLRKEYPVFMGRKKKSMSFVDFVDTVLLAGLKQLKK